MSQEEIGWQRLVAAAVISSGCGASCWLALADDADRTWFGNVCRIMTELRKDFLRLPSAGPSRRTWPGAAESCASPVALDGLGQEQLAGAELGGLEPLTPAVDVADGS